MVSMIAFISFALRESVWFIEFVHSPDPFDDGPCIPLWTPKTNQTKAGDTFNQVQLGSTHRDASLKAELLLNL